MAYLQKREAIFKKTEQVDRAYVMLLKSVKAQQDFFSYETKSGSYFQTGESHYFDDYRIWLDSTQYLLTSIDIQSEEILFEAMETQYGAIKQTDSLFLQVIALIKERGFKDHNLEGQMRNEAHWLESAPEISRANVLSMRRHEKDYIIRNEPQYVDKLVTLAKKIQVEVQSNRSISQARKEVLIGRLQTYVNKFSRLVTLDKRIGIKDNTGLKKTLDDRIVQVEMGFSGLVQQTRHWARSEFDRLTLYFGLTVAALVAISILISALIASKITEPLTELTSHITRFVESNFTLETEHPVVRSKDEIGSLTQNFSVLKDEVISRMKFFKQKVEERTAELAEANIKLVRISEANSRFVPKEFLNNLGKSSIEEVTLGDQVAREMTVVFTDIRDFTSLSENLSPQANFDFLNEYLSGIVPIILKHGDS